MIRHYWSPFTVPVPQDKITDIILYKMQSVQTQLNIQKLKQWTVIIHPHKIITIYFFVKKYFVAKLLNEMHTLKVKHLLHLIKL